MTIEKTLFIYNRLQSRSEIIVRIPFSIRLHLIFCIHFSMGVPKRPTTNRLIKQGFRHVLHGNLT